MADVSSIFTGSSQFSNDFKQVIDRSVAIASLPLTALNQQKAILADKQQAYSTIGDRMSSVRSAIDAIASAGTTTFNAISTNLSTVTASATTGAVPGGYDINVLTAGAYTVAMSGAGLNVVNDPSAQNIAAGTAFTLTVDGKATTLTLAGENLNSLATAINNANAGVQATIVNLGPPAAPDYRLSLRSTDWRAADIHLTSGAQELVSVLSSGNPALYTVNGQPPGGISTTQPAVTLAPGVTATIKGQGTAHIDISTSRDSLTRALSSFTKAYNDAVDELNKYHGENAGVLKGESQVRTLANDLRNIVNFGAGTSAGSLASLGLTFDKTGHVQFDSSALNSMPDTALSSFLDPNNSAGFIATARRIMDGVENDVLPSTNDLITKAMARQDQEIAATQHNIDLLQQSLNAKMAAADSTIAALEQDATYYTNLFDSMKSNSKN